MNEVYDKKKGNAVVKSQTGKTPHRGYFAPRHGGKNRARDHGDADF